MTAVGMVACCDVDDDSDDGDGDDDSDDDSDDVMKVHTPERSPSTS